MKLKSIVSTVILAFCFAFMSNAQSFTKGDFIVDAGIKLSIYNINNANDDSEDGDDKAVSYTIPVGVEYAIGSKLGLGLQIGICNYFTEEDSVTRAIAKANSFDVLIKGNFHWVRGSRVGLASGLGLGFSAFNYESNDSYDSKFESTGFYLRVNLVDFKVYFSDHLGMYGSIGIPYMNFENGRITDNLGSDFSFPLTFAGFDIGTGLVYKW